MTRSDTSIVRRELAPTTRTEQTIEPAAFVADTAELRDAATETTSEATRLHRNAEDFHLQQLTRQLEAVPPVDLLDALADELLFPWSLLARVVGVSPTAVRKWRKGETVTPAYHQRLAEFVAFCRTLKHRDPRIDDVPHWIEMPVDARSEITRLDLFLRGVRTELLEFAGSRRTGESLLDAAAPEWRERFATASRFDVVFHEDGSTSIVPKPEAVPREG